MPATTARRKRGLLGRLLRWFLLLVAAFYSLVFLGFLALRWIDPPFTMVHVQRRIESWFHRGAYRKSYVFVPLADISPAFQHAVIAAEDTRFFHHHGFDWHEVQDAVEDGLEEGRIRGASTIDEQLAKNLFLSREKTVTRKVKEIYLAWRMEQELTKGRIIELYLNIVELGPMVYGIGHGARYYFDKPASALTPRECAFLAAMLPGPQKVYNPYRHLDRVLKRSDTVLRRLREKGVLTEAEYRLAQAETPDISGMQKKVDRSFTGKVRKFFKNLFGLFQ